MISISIDSRELNRFFRDIKKFEESKQAAIKKEVSRATFSIQKKAKENAPGKKGFLRNHIDAKILNRQLTGEVIVKAKYGIFVHEKTKPHEIRIKTKKVLAFSITSSQFKNYSGAKSLQKVSTVGMKRKVTYDRWAILGVKVNHPGTKGNPFLRKAVNSERPIYTSNLIKIFK